MSATKPNAWIDRLIRQHCKKCPEHVITDPRLKSLQRALYRGCGMAKGRCLAPGEECFKSRWSKAKEGEKVPFQAKTKGGGITTNSPKYTKTPNQAVSHTDLPNRLISMNGS